MKNNLRITAAQINATVGDIAGNATKIIASALYARDTQNADIVVFPEMALTGYPPEDLLLRHELYDQLQVALRQIQTKVKNIYIILGLPIKKRQHYFNSAVVIYNHKILAAYHKQVLPNHGVFDEKRYFTAGTTSCIITIKGTKIAILICADLWAQQPARAAKKMQARLIISLNASPFDLQKPLLREQILAKRAKENNLPIIYVNTAGAQDDLVFDGGSLVANAQGIITPCAPFFSETLAPIDIALTTRKLCPIPNKRFSLKYNAVEHVYKALVLGVQDYIEKNNIKGVIVGASGGIDSALTLAIAVDALGKERVEAIYLPSRYSSKLSTAIVKESAKLLGVKHRIISIEPMLPPFLNNLSDKQATALSNITLQNLQARCRGIILMALSNETGSIVLSTGNKSEMAVGYATLYGDMVGGFCVLKDVYKTLVYQLAEYRNKISYVIPKRAITRAPTAELAKKQQDTDDLPPYAVLDEILKRYMELNQPLDKIVAAGFNKEIVAKIIAMIKNSEYKRRQAPPGIKITSCAFGRERRYPITSKFVEKL